MKCTARMPKSMRFCSPSIGKALGRWTRMPCECPACGPACVLLAASSGLWGPWRSRWQLPAQRWPVGGGGHTTTTEWSPLQQQQQQTQKSKAGRCSGIFFSQSSFYRSCLLFFNKSFLFKWLNDCQNFTQGHMYCDLSELWCFVLFLNKTSKQTHKNKGL